MHSRLDWAFCQENADEILAQGIYALRHSEPHPHSIVTCARPGNYLISLRGEPLYVGEAMDVSSRIKQQFRVNTSTFYKNYLKAGHPPLEDLSSFMVQYMPTQLGRKEIEDFGIVNIPTSLNRFQLGKRDLCRRANNQDLWQQVQSHSEALVADGARAFLARSRSPMFEVTVPGNAGLYSIWPRGEHDPIYIGESSDIGTRHETHCQHTYFSALRRHVGTVILGYSLKTRKGKTRYFADDEDRHVTEYLRSCHYSFMSVAIGRYELEESLIRDSHPLLNRKGALKPGS